MAPVICFIFWRRFREAKQWQSLSRWTMAAILGIVVALILLHIVPMPPDAPNIFTPYAGLIQRTAIIAYMAWIFIFALHLSCLRQRT
jgi:hypothetical protein